MKKEVDDERFKILRSDLARLRLRFPVVVLAKRLGVSKGTVSLYINGQLPVSDNFLNRFYKAFDIELRNAPPVEETESESLNSSEPANSDLLPILRSIDERLEGLTNLFLHRFSPPEGE